MNNMQADDDRASILDQLRKAGLLDVPELTTLRSKQQIGAGTLPQPLNMLAPMVTSVPQPDR